MITYREQVESALRAVTVTSPTSYAWFGRQSRPLPRAVASALAPDSARQILIDGLKNELYRSFYTQGRPVPLSTNGVPGPPDHAFVKALSRANSGMGGWQQGWRVERVQSGTVLVVRDGLRVRVPVSDCRGGDRACIADGLVSIRRPKEMIAGSPGFYTALGNTEPTAGSAGVEVRLYFNVCAEGATPLVAMCTRLLNEARVPFDLKVIGDPWSFPRGDAAVLYVDNGDFQRLRKLLWTIVSTCDPHLHGAPPAFAKPLARGVAVGEHSPSLGPSFGTSRCRLVAEGIVAAYESGARQLAARIDAVARRFAMDGLDIESPYLAPGSDGHYEL
jgi:HopA1 effector protein family